MKIKDKAEKVTAAEFNISSAYKWHNQPVEVVLPPKDQIFSTEDFLKNLQ